MHLILFLILGLCQESSATETNWRILRVLEDTYPFKSLNSIYRKKAVQNFWSENTTIMEEITQNWELLLKNSKDRKWRAYLKRNPNFKQYLGEYVMYWTTELVATNHYVQTQLSRIDSVAYKKLLKLKSQLERLNEISSWEEEHEDAFNLIREFELEVFQNGKLIPKLIKPKASDQPKINPKKIVNSLKNKKHTSQSNKLKRKKLETKIRQTKLNTVKSRVSAEINRQAREFMQSDAIKNGFRGSTAAKNRAFVEQSVRETTLRWMGKDIEKKVRAEIESEIEAEVKKQMGGN